jgi:hypothetical protein
LQSSPWAISVPLIWISADDLECDIYNDGYKECEKKFTQGSVILYTVAEETRDVRERLLSK